MRVMSARGEQAASTPTDDVPTGSAPEGVHIIHTIPSGVACVYDQAVRTMKPGQTFEELLRLEYEDADVAQQLAQQNDLLPSSDGTMAVFVPPHEPVVIPEMCYLKEGAGSVSLQATGVPDDSSGGAALAGFVLIALAIAAVVLGWRWLTARVVKVR